MSGFGTFLALVFATIGTMMLIADPAQKMTKWANGKTESQLKQESEAYIKQNSVAGLFGQGCYWVFFYLVALCFTFIIEPIAIISALSGKIGFQPLAWACLIIEAISWVVVIRGLRAVAKATAEANKKKEEKVQETGIDILDPTGTVVISNGQVVDKEIKFPNPVWMFTRKVFFSIPTFFLWYLFAVGIGLVH
jgi:hypothetical protein